MEDNEFFSFSGFYYRHDQNIRIAMLFGGIDLNIVDNLIKNNFKFNFDTYCFDSFLKLKNDKILTLTLSNVDDIFILKLSLEGYIEEYKSNNILKLLFDFHLKFEKNTKIYSYFSIIDLLKTTNLYEEGFVELLNENGKLSENTGIFINDTYVINQEYISSREYHIRSSPHYTHYNRGMINKIKKDNKGRLINIDRTIKRNITTLSKDELDNILNLLQKTVEITNRKSFKDFIKSENLEE